MRLLRPAVIRSGVLLFGGLRVWVGDLGWGGGVAGGMSYNYC